MVALAPRRPALRMFSAPALLLVLALVVASLGAAPARPTQPALAPALVSRITSSVESPLQLIVRTAGSLEQLAATVRQLGGEVRAELRLIDALAVSLPANRVQQLAALELVRSISHDAALVDTQTREIALPLDAAKLKTVYNQAIGATQLWSRPNQPLRGDGVTVAIIDSGLNPQEDFYTIMGRSRVLTSAAFQQGYDRSPFDSYGHGNHVAGIIAGNGRRSNYNYVGVAPNANLISVRVLDSNGTGTLTSMIQGLEWIYNNQQAYNIRVVNISINSSEQESYTTSPLSAAVEALWFSGIVVVVSAGNNGTEALFPPANDPFVITVGASDDRGTATTADDTIAKFSAFGRTKDKFPKPDLVAPGTNIVSMMTGSNGTLASLYQQNIVDRVYFRMSGTSMAAPMVSGAVALLLQAEPTLTPDEVKFRLMATARPFSSKTRAGAGHLDIAAAVNNRVAGRANQDLPVNTLLAVGEPGINWSAVTSGSVNWRGKGTAFFGSVNWRGKTEGTSASVYWGK